ncbi:DnaB-like helicase N-terminal domain-containing protein [Streptomyces sp. NPDC001633]|uniref:DnaB-like helicase N-terminal domain-containing protein n=1 Tax=Streptomyces sp. NPDC001633 TaxID=3364595 RepID=UPI003692C43F
MSSAEERAAELAEAEQAVLGTMLRHGVQDLVPDLVQLLEGSDFYQPHHGRLWDRLCVLRATGEPCDPVTVTADLRKRGELEALGGAAYLHELHDAVPTTAHALHYAEIIREESQWRALAAAGTRTMTAVQRREGTAAEAAERSVEDARAVRDRAVAELAPSRDLLDFLQEHDDEPDWVIPGVLARWDRLMITAGEGGGKSLLLRQILMRAAAGLHPWKRARIRPVRVLLIDCENSDSQIRPWLRRMADAAAGEGAAVRRGQFRLEVRPDGLDLTSAADRAWLARTVEQAAPDLMSIGPLYKLSTNGKSDEEAARPLMSALEMIRIASGGAAMVLEAHAPHATMGRRDLRPIGSSLWLRWPEFGFGLSPATELGAEEQRLMDWVPWRGPRSERSWPEQLCEGATWPWQAIEFAGNAPIPTGITLTDEQAAAWQADEQAAAQRTKIPTQIDYLPDPEDDPLPEGQ